MGKFARLRIDTGRIVVAGCPITIRLWRDNPAMGAVLRCIDCPADGGDTIWVNMVEAYARLPQDIKERIADLRARSSTEHSFGAAMSIEERHSLAGLRRGPRFRSWKSARE